MKKLKYPRTIYYDANLKQWVSFYVNKKNETVIEATAKSQKALLKTGLLKGNINKLSKDRIDDYSYFIENKKSHKFDYMIDYIEHNKELKKVVKKKYITPDDLIKSESMSPKKKEQFLNKFITDKDEKFLKAMSKNPYFEKDKELIKSKLKNETKKVKTEHVIKRVVSYKLSSSNLFIPQSEHVKLKKILEGRGRISLKFKIGEEEFFTHSFEAKANTNYEKILNTTLKKYPSKISHNMKDLKIQVV